MMRAIVIAFLFGLLVACGPVETKDAPPSTESAETGLQTSPTGETDTSAEQPKSLSDATEGMVEVGHNRLSPNEITIAVGETVTFHNQDEMPGGHTLVADDGSFQSPPLKKGEEWSRTFEKPGTYDYHMRQHPDAKGTITVE